MIRNYHNHKLQTNPWQCEEEPHSNHETRTTNIEQLQTPTMGVTINMINN